MARARGSALGGALAAVMLCFALEGCGKRPDPKPGPTPPTPSPTPSPPSPSPVPDGYDGNPPFMLEDVGMKAFSYNPLFLADPSCLEQPGRPACGSIINDDVSAEWGENMWSETGRGDIKTMATFGANAVRLYGNDPRFSKRRFFDELLKNNMKAITGMSNYPFAHQDSPQGCIWYNKYDCFQNASDSFYQILEQAARPAAAPRAQGEFAKNGQYHNAIEVISIMNEPDINAWNPGAWSSNNNYIKAMVSGFDGILSAEKKANIRPWKNNKLPKITVAWSYAMLPRAECGQQGYIKHLDDPASQCGPSIGFMAQLYYAMQDPEGTVGYTPQNDLKTAYRERWILALQPFNPAAQVYQQAIAPALKWLPLKGYKMYFGEFDPAVNMCGDKPSCPSYGKKQLEADLKTILTDPKWKDKVLGVSFFNFQQTYNKAGPHEVQYGMFKMRKEAPWRTGYIEGDSAKNHPINCLEWKTQDLGEAVAAAYGGSLPKLTCKGSVSEDTVQVVI